MTEQSTELSTAEVMETIAKLENRAVREVRSGDLLQAAVIRERVKKLKEELKHLK